MKVSIGETVLMRIEGAERIGEKMEGEGRGERRADTC